MKSITLFFLIFFTFLLTSAQDSISIKNLLQMKVGVYKTQKNFFAKMPDIEKPLQTVINYIKDKKSDSSIAYGYSYKFIDSSKIDKKAFGFFDGQNMYIQTEKNIFFKCKGFGRYPYLYVRACLWY